MKRAVAAILLGLASLSCASVTPEGARVNVYEASVDQPDTPVPPLPPGCKLLATSGPIDQQQQAREISDPYRAQRNQTAALGGNVLYLRSYRFMNLMKTDCPVGDKSEGCMDQSQSWYKVSFRSYACDEAALAELASAPQPSVPGVFRWDLKKKAPMAVEPAAAPAAAAAPVARTPVSSPAEAAALKSKVLALLQEGVGADVVVSFVRANRPASPLTAEEIIDWKRSGISDAIIEATFAK